MPTKKSAKKTATATSTKKKTAKKAAVKKSAAAKKTASAKKAPAKKTTAKKVVKEKVTEKKAAKKETRKPLASDFVKRPSHTPAIFKPASKRPAHILFTLDDVREVLKKRPRDEETGQKAAAKKAAKKTAEPAAAAPEKASKHAAASLDDILGLSGGSNSQMGGPGNVPRKFQKYHKLLIELRDHVREELNLHSNDTLKRSQKEDAGDISISVDAGTDNFDRDFALSLLSSEQESLKEIEAAIQRIYNGTYGYCEVTGEAIKPERLEAVPFTRFSLEGQRQHEMNSYKRTSRAGAFLNEASGEPITFGDDDGEN